MAPKIFMLETIDNFNRSRKTPVWVNVNNDNYQMGYLVNVEGVDPVMDTLPSKRERSARHIWIPLKTRIMISTIISKMNYNRFQSVIFYYMGGPVDGTA